MCSLFFEDKNLQMCTKFFTQSFFFFCIWLRTAARSRTGAWLRYQVVQMTIDDHQMRVLNMVFETIEIFVSLVARSNGTFKWPLTFLFDVTFIVPVMTM
jgi:hypothetical protein